jgi:hypothetical protein
MATTRKSPRRHRAGYVEYQPKPLRYVVRTDHELESDERWRQRVAQAWKADGGRVPGNVHIW